MKVIHKMKVEITDEQTLFIKGTKVLHFANQNGNLCVWYETDSDLLDMLEMEYTLCIVGTGSPICFDEKNYWYDYVTTVQINGLVWHLYHKWAIG